MKKTAVVCMVLLFLGVTSFLAQAAEGQKPVEKFLAQEVDRFEEGCRTELNAYCQGVTPGRARRLACIYAHNDKLSQKCENALYDSAADFQTAAENLVSFTRACETDIQHECSNVEVGEGRVLACLNQNKEKIAGKCREALQKMGESLAQKGLIRE